MKLEACKKILYDAGIVVLASVAKCQTSSSEGGEFESFFLNSHRTQVGYPKVQNFECTGHPRTSKKNISISDLLSSSPGIGYFENRFNNSQSRSVRFGPQ